MMRPSALTWALFVCVTFLPAPALAAPGEQFYRLHEGITAYVPNPEGKDFTVRLAVRDLNLYANGPREVLFKVYDPDGKPVVREVIPDDGCTTANLPDRIGGWDHELQYFINLYAKGTTPSLRWGAWSDPNRLRTIVARTFDRPVKGAKKGTYRIVLAGTPDHYVTLRLSPALPYAVSGHPTFLHGHGDLLKKAFLYVPKGTTGLFLAVVEPDEPRRRRFKLTAPDGKVLFDGHATGGFFSPAGADWGRATAGFTGGGYDGKLLTLEVSEGANDYLIKVTFQQPRKGAFAEYVGMGSSAVFAPDEATARAVAGGTVVVDGETFWHPFQVRFHRWLKANALSATAEQRALRKELEAIHNGFWLLETGDGRGSASWTNWAYAMGYYGCHVFRPGWALVRRPDVPAEVKALIREGLLVAGDRLSFATHIEKVNGNAFAQINVALWYAHKATGDGLQKERFETFWRRWTTEGWGAGSGLSRSGDAQEHFAHDMHYGSYLLDNWAAGGNTWVKGGGILGDSDDPRFQKVVDRYRELYSYLHCREASGAPVAANPWSGRTHMAAHPSKGAAALPWKGERGPDLTADVNGGHEWFAARRKGYYFLSFHGRLTPEWMNQCFEGQLGFGGGVLCQLTVPGKGPVLASTLNGSYGKGMHPSEWRNFHPLVGERWDGAPLVAAISEHEAKLEGNTVTSAGEVRGGHVKATRSYTFGPTFVDCSVRLATSDYAQALSLWGPGRRWSEVRLAYEMVPYLPRSHDGKAATAVRTAEGAPLDARGATTRRVRVDRGGFGVEIQFDAPRAVKLGQNNTVLIELVGPGARPTPAEKVGLKYRLVPFG